MPEKIVIPGSLAIYLEGLVREMVDDPDAVRLEVVPTASGAIYRISVSPRDLGRVIGKQGRTAHALRVTLHAIATKKRQTLRLDIVGWTDSGAT